MNERIKALMGKTLDSEFSHTWDTMTYEGLLQFSEKFAELIVLECIKCCDEIDDINKTYREVRLVDPEFGPKECIATIKAHFGVEE